MQIECHDMFFKDPYKYYNFIFAVLCHHFLKYLDFFTCKIEHKQHTLANCKFLTANSNHV